MSDTAAAVPAIEKAGAADQPSTKRRKAISHTEVKGGERKVVEASARIFTTAPPSPQHMDAPAVIATHEEAPAAATNVITTASPAPQQHLRARKARAVTKPVFTKFNTRDKVQAMVDKRDTEITKVYRVNVKLWKNGAFEGATRPPAHRACRPYELRRGATVVGADGIADGQPVHLTVERVIRGRVNGNPHWVVCKGIDGNVLVIPVDFVGVPMAGVQ